MTNEYIVTVDQTGHSEGFAVVSPDGRQMTYVDHDYAGGEKQAEDDASLIAEALNDRAALREALKALLPLAEEEAYRLSELSRAEFEYVEAADNAWEAIGRAKELIAAHSPGRAADGPGSRGS